MIRNMNNLLIETNQARMRTNDTRKLVNESMLPLQTLPSPVSQVGSREADHLKISLPSWERDLG